jgi:tRNA nucleotidyltransferase/poly(A) polymerase
MFSNLPTSAEAAAATAPSAVTTKTEEENQHSLTPEGISAAKIASLLQPYNPELSSDQIKTIADAINITLDMSDFEIAILKLEELKTQCQFDPESLAYLASCYKIVGKKELTIANYRAAIDLYDKATNIHNQNSIITWRFNLGVLLARDKQFDEARMPLALAILSSHNYYFTETLNEDITEAVKSLNNHTLSELQQQAPNEENTAVLQKSHLTNEHPLNSSYYVARATQRLSFYKINKDKKQLEAAFYDYCIADWLVRSGQNTVIIEDIELYHQKIKINCYTLADKLGYAVLDQLKETEDKKDVASTSVKPAASFKKMIFVTEKTQQLLALNPNTDYEILTNYAKQIYELGSAPLEYGIAGLEKINKACKLDIMTLKFLQSQKIKSVMAALASAAQNEKKIASSSHATAAQRAVDTDALIRDFENAGMHEIGLRHLIQVIEFDLESGLLSQLQQKMVREQSIELLIQLHQLPLQKNVPTMNEKKMAEKFAKQNPQKAIEYINHAIREEQVNPRDYLFRGDMRVRLAKTQKDCQLALADYYFAKWLVYRKLASVPLLEIEKNKISNKIHAAKEKMDACEKPTAPMQKSIIDDAWLENESAASQKMQNKKTQKKHKEENTATVLKPVEAKQEQKNVSAAAAAQTTEAHEKKKPSKFTSPIAATSASHSLISSADYGDWEEETEFTPFTTRKQKRSQQSHQQITPKPASTKPAYSVHQYPQQTPRTRPAHTHTQRIKPVTASFAIPKLPLPVTAVQPIAAHPIIAPPKTQTIPDNRKTPEPISVSSSVAEEAPPHKISLPSEACEIILKLKEKGAKLSFAVGGIVRDNLMGISTLRADIDLVTAASDAQLKEWLKDYPDLTITKNDNLFQFTLNKRKIEIWTSDYLAKVDAADPVKADAESRDFNIDALYSDENGIVIDPLHVYGCETIDTLIDPIESLQNDPIRILRAIYLMKKLDLGLSERLDKAIDASIASLKDVDPFALRSLFSKILVLEKCTDIFNEFNRRGLLQALFPEFTHKMSTSDICERIKSVSPNKTLPWVYINMVADVAIDAKQYRHVLEIENAKEKLAAINQLLADVQQNVSHLKKNKLLSITFPDQHYFDTLLETAFQANRMMTNLRREQSILIQVDEQLKIATQNYEKENNSLRAQNELLLQAIQQQKQEEAAIAYQQQFLQQQAIEQQMREQQQYQLQLQQQAEQQHQQYMMYQQMLYAQTQQQTRFPTYPNASQSTTYYNPSQAAPFTQNRNGFVQSWQHRPRHAVPTDTEVKSNSATPTRPGFKQ